MELPKLTFWDNAIFTAEMIVGGTMFILGLIILQIITILTDNILYKLFLVGFSYLLMMRGTEDIFSAIKKITKCN